MTGVQTCALPIFYFDVEASVLSPDTQTVLSQLEKEPFFTFLGAYSEVF